MTVLDLFAGIGGFSLAAHQCGMQTAAFVEWDRYNQKVLKKNFPGVPVFGDIKKFSYASFKSVARKAGIKNRSIDIVCGGFPCQPFSTAGKREGANDDRYLWPEMLRIIREVQPAYVLGENVAGLLSMDGGRVFEQICTSLENEGYAVQPFVVPACAVGAPHRRDRVWIVAYAESKRRGKARQCSQRPEKRNCGASSAFAYAPQKQHHRTVPAWGGWQGFANGDRSFANAISKPGRAASGTWLDTERAILEEAGWGEGSELSTALRGDVADASSIERKKGNDGLCQPMPKRSGGATRHPNGNGRQENTQHRDKGARPRFSQGAPTGTSGRLWTVQWPQVATRLCRVDDGVPTWMDRYRTNRLKSLGNAIVPQVAERFLSAIQKHYHQ